MAARMIDWFGMNEGYIQGALVATLLAASVQAALRAGVLSFAGAGFYGVGAYGFGYLTTVRGWGTFAAIAAVLAGVGLYGVLATGVRQRTPEIGVRMALGAPRASILRLVIGEGVRLSAVGVAVGVAAALVLTRVMRSMLVGVEANDPATFAAIAVLFFGITAPACWLPARRAADLDPKVAFREE